MKDGLGTKKSIVYILYAVVLGALVGAFVWVFLRVVSLGIKLVWEYIPSQFEIPYYTIAVCLIGAVIIAVLRLAFGNYPETMEEVIGRVKREGKYPYNNIFVITLCALVPLMFGGSLGPEAGLTGVAVGLCFWVGDKLKLAGKSLKSFTSLGISTALGVLFGSLLFGIAAYIEPETDDDEEFVLPKPFEIFAKIIAVFGGLMSYFLLGEFFGSGMAFTQITFEEITNFDRIMGIPYILFGILLGMLYALFRKFSYIVFKKLNRTKLLSFLSVLLGGLILGIMGTLIPLTMFSGEEQIALMAESYKKFAPSMLILIGVAKLFLTNFCIYSGWKGGNFFPMIFSGVAIGYGVSMIFSTSTTMTVAAITAALLAVNLRKPVAVSLLLLLCFPVRVIPWLILASFAAANIPLPRFLMLPEQIKAAELKKQKKFAKHKAKNKD